MSKRLILALGIGLAFCPNSIRADDSLKSSAAWLPWAHPKKVLTTIQVYEDARTCPPRLWIFAAEGEPRPSSGPVLTRFHVVVIDDQGIVSTQRFRYTSLEDPVSLAAGHTSLFLYDETVHAFSVVSTMVKRVDPDSGKTHIYRLAPVGYVPVSAEKQERLLKLALQQSKLQRQNVQSGDEATDSPSVTQADEQLPPVHIGFLKLSKEHKFSRIYGTFFGLPFDKIVAGDTGYTLSFNDSKTVLTAHDCATGEEIVLIDVRAE